MNSLLVIAFNEFKWYDHVGTWLAVLLTLAILSFLYKDNVVYKMAEHVFVGVAAGYTIAISFWSVFVPNLWEPLFMGRLKPVNPDVYQWLDPVIWRWLLIVPLALGLFFFARFHKGTAWMSRWSIAFLVGLYAGVNATGYFQGDLILQAKATFVSLDPNAFLKADPDAIWNGWHPVLLKQLPILLGVLATLTYFFFSKPHKGFVGQTARVGVYFLMVAFGASFGYTVMGRISLFIGRVNYLVYEWANNYFF